MLLRCHVHAVQSLLLLIGQAGKHLQRPREHGALFGSLGLLSHASGCADGAAACMWLYR